MLKRQNHRLQCGFIVFAVPFPGETHTWKARKAASKPEMPAGTTEPVSAESAEAPVQ